MDTKDQDIAGGSASREKKPYTAPVLVFLGSSGALTENSSGAASDTVIFSQATGGGGGS